MEDFLRGVASIFDIAGWFSRPPKPADDRTALAIDWQAVANDLAKALEATEPGPLGIGPTGRPR